MRDLLNEEIKQEFGELPNLGIGSSEYEKTVSGLEKLMSTEIDIYKFEAERQDKLDQQKRQEELQREKDELDRIEKQNQKDLQQKQLELQLKQAEIQAKQNQRSNGINLLQIGLTALTAVAGLALTVWSYNKSWDEEKEGNMITTDAGKDSQKKAFGKR